MDARIHASTHHLKSSSLYGFDLLRYVQDHSAYARSAYETAAYVLTHGGNFPMEEAVKTLGVYDSAALSVLDTHHHLTVTQDPSATHGQRELAMSVNSLGRLHIRPSADARPFYSDDDRWVALGFIAIDQKIAEAIVRKASQIHRSESDAMAEIKRALDELALTGQLGDVLEQVIDHVQHVESVCFYVGDRFFALIDRYVNLIDDKRSKGFLSSLRDKPYAQWHPDEILIIAALHALFLSGRSVRYEEFNGAQLSARAVMGRLNELSEAYRTVGCEVAAQPRLLLFDRAQDIREQTLRGIGQSWLRYRWIYGLNFQKKERILSSTDSTEESTAYLAEFQDLYADLCAGGHGDHQGSESIFFAQMAWECLARDAAAIPCEYGGAATAWLEYLMEKIVASAVVATRADYGMSSSLRDIGGLIEYHEAKLIEVIHALTPADFFTCFVSNNLEQRLGEEESRVIASSVQKRMMFNRWHFLPGNLARTLICQSRHWYYPPLIPDIAIHADMHRAAHNRARVKYSIRSPGPDMSRPALQIAGQRYRGFYDIRVVRMEGDPFTTEDMLRVRRRTLWLEVVYGALTAYLMGPSRKAYQVKGFQPGTYLDLLAAPVEHGVGLAADAVAAQ